MTRALAVLTGVAWVVLVIEQTATPARLWPAVLTAAVYAAVALAAFPWVRRRPPGLGRHLWSAGYVLLQLLLGFAVFSLSGAGIGATLLLLVLVSQSVLLLPLPAAALVTAVVPLVHVGMDLASGLRNGLGVLGAAVFTAVVTELVQREQRARAELATANAALREYAAQAEDLATAQERNRLAREIHDGLGHHLTVVQMQVQAARAVLDADPGRADAVLEKAQHQAVEALAEVRRSVAALREPRSSPPLPVALEALAAEVSAAGISTDIQVTGSIRELRSETEASLYRAAQEGLTNVRKHAEACAARLLLTYGDSEVTLEVCDDGVGFTPAAATGFGLMGLRERAERLGGKLAVSAAPGHGTRLRIEVPG